MEGVIKGGGVFPCQGLADPFRVCTCLNFEDGDKPIPWINRPTNTLGTPFSVGQIVYGGQSDGGGARGPPGMEKGRARESSSRV